MYQGLVTPKTHTQAHTSTHAYTHIGLNEFFVVLVNSMTTMQSAGTAVDCANGIASGPTADMQEMTTNMMTTDAATEGLDGATGATVDSVTDSGVQFRWEAIVLWIVLKTLQGADILRPNRIMLLCY